MGKKFVGLDGLSHFWTKAKAWITDKITTEVTAKIAEIVADAPEDLNTLKEIADWINTHADSASAMNTQITDNTNAITSLQASVAGKSDSGHTHDDRYYTESEIDTKLSAKSDTGHIHTKSQITDFPSSLPANGGTATDITNKIDATSVSHTNYNINGAYVPTMNFLSYWNGAYNSGGLSNLKYSASGTIIGSSNIGSQSVASAVKLTSKTSEMLVTDGISVENFAKTITYKYTAGTLLSRNDWAWANSRTIALDSSVSLDTQRYSCLVVREGNLNNIWQQHALLFIPTYTDSSTMYLVQMTVGGTAGSVSTTVLPILSAKGGTFTGAITASGGIICKSGSEDGETVSIGNEGGLVTIGDTDNENGGYTTINNDCRMLYDLTVNSAVTAMKRLRLPLSSSYNLSGDIWMDAGALYYKHGSYIYKIQGTKQS